MSQYFTQCRFCNQLFTRGERHLHPCYAGEKEPARAHYVIPDINPYQAVALDSKTGKAPVITSRKEHREFLRRNNLVEVGNEMPKPKAKEADHNVRQELTQATHEVMRKYR